jgi:hypothetical protein
VQGGLDSVGNVLGDLWRGERRTDSGQHYSWRWRRVLAGDATTKRFGHTMTFDPGLPGGIDAPRAKLVVFGGWKSNSELADPAKLYAVGVGSQSVQPGVWREITATGHHPAGARLACHDPAVAQPKRQRTGLLHVRRRERRL